MELEEIEHQLAASCHGCLGYGIQHSYTRGDTWCRHCGGSGKARTYKVLDHRGLRQYPTCSTDFAAPYKDGDD